MTDYVRKDDLPHDGLDSWKNMYYEKYDAYTKAGKVLRWRLKRVNRDILNDLEKAHNQTDDYDDLQESFEKAKAKIAEIFKEKKVLKNELSEAINERNIEANGKRLLMSRSLHHQLTADSNRKKMESLENQLMGMNDFNVIDPISKNAVKNKKKRLNKKRKRLEEKVNNYVDEMFDVLPSSQLAQETYLEL